MHHTHDAGIIDTTRILECFVFADATRACAATDAFVAELARHEHAHQLLLLLPAIEGNATQEITIHYLSLHRERERERARERASERERERERGRARGRERGRGRGGEKKRERERERE